MRRRLAFLASVISLVTALVLPDQASAQNLHYGMNAQPNLFPLGAPMLDKLAELREDATRERLVGAEHAAEAVRETWRALEELNLAPQLAFEALFIRIGREL